jgi:hypothetical protein
MVALRSKFARFFVIVVLLSSLACAEFPELASLADNTSNDFTTHFSLGAEGAMVGAIRAMAKAPASRRMACEEYLRIPRRISLFGISRNLLLLCSVLRT